MAKFKDVEEIFLKKCEEYPLKLGVNKLKPKIKAKWIEALTSGEYPQTQGMLHRDNPKFGAREGYCCLGVLAYSIRRTKAFKEDFGTIANLTGRGDVGQPTRDYTGLTVRMSSILVHLNDNTKANFKQIAKIIDKYL